MPKIRKENLSTAPAAHRFKEVMAIKVKHNFLAITKFRNPKAAVRIHNK